MMVLMIVLTIVSIASPNICFNSLNHNLNDSNNDDDHNNAGSPGTP